MSLAFHVALLVIMAAIVFRSPARPGFGTINGSFDTAIGQEPFDTVEVPEVDFTTLEPVAASTSVTAVKPLDVGDTSLNVSTIVSSGEGQGESPTSADVASRVSAAGGSTGVVQFSLAWNTVSDLDLHILTPDEEHISFRNRSSDCGGRLDVDMNASRLTSQPVENVRWAESTPKGGMYEVVVHIFTNRDRSERIPFTLRVKLGSQVIVREGFVYTNKRKENFRFRYRPSRS